MKKLVAIAALALMFAAADTAGAQEPSTGKKVTNTVKKAGKKTGETGAKAAAKVKDKSLKNEKGPNGETVYVDKYDRKYYVNKNAKRVYIKN
jgi:hypothetical protein